MARGVEIIGDLPMYVALNSADVWANRHLFDLTEDGEPKNVAGVPPDYFSEFGQKWGTKFSQAAFGRAPGAVIISTV